MNEGRLEEERKDTIRPKEICRPYHIYIYTATMTENLSG